MKKLQTFNVGKDFEQFNIFQRVRLKTVKIEENAKY